MDGGANRSMMQLILELRRDYCINPIVLLPQGNKHVSEQGLDNECVKNGITYFETFIPWTCHSKPWSHRMKYIACLASYPFLLNKIKKQNIDLIHSNGGVIELGGWLSHSLGVPHVWHLREFGYENNATTFVWGRDYYVNSFKRGDAFIAISDAIKNTFSKYIPERKIYRIYNGISIEKYKQQACHTNNVCQFVMAGMITEHKNQMEAVKATSILIKRGIKDFHISFIGNADSEYLNQIRNYIKQQELTDYISILGYRNDVPDLLKEMDVGLMLSKTEAFGRVTVEYMFQGLAVIASDTGANPEIISDEDTGLLYHLGDIETLADKMKKFIKNRPFLICMAENGKKSAMKNFSSIKNTRSIYNLYTNLMEKKQISIE